MGAHSFRNNPLKNEKDWIGKWKTPKAFDKMSIDETIKNLLFFETHKWIKNPNYLKSIFYSFDSSSEPTKIIDYCRKVGYDISGRIGFEIIDGSRSFPDKLGLYIFCAQHNIWKDECYKNIIKICNDSSGFSEWDLSKVKKILPKEYDDVVNNLEQKSKLSVSFFLCLKFP